MSDITKCRGDNCPHRVKCYRFIAPGSVDYQSYFVDPPIKDDGSCEYFWGEQAKSIMNQLKDIVNGK
jgi:hypothetical protein